MNFHYKEPSFRMVLLVSTSVDRRLMKSSKVQFEEATSYVVFVIIKKSGSIQVCYANQLFSIGCTQKGATSRKPRVQPCVGPDNLERLSFFISAKEVSCAEGLINWF